MPSHGVMEGRGAYNKYAKLPAGGAALALPLFERAASNVELDTSDLPVVIADYGSSQGKNSLGRCNRQFESCGTDWLHTGRSLCST
jgi:hypothetical protein